MDDASARLPDLMLPPMPPAMPAEIAAAIAQVKSGITRLHKGECNQHRGFNYASVDQFYEAIGPLEAEAGLVVLPQSVRAPRRETVKTRGGEQTVVVYSFAFMIAHSSGKSWCNPADICEQPVAWMGAQTAGAAKSYAHKYYLRSLYSVPTGERDADAQERWDDAEASARAVASKERRAAGKAATGARTYVINLDHMAELAPEHVAAAVRGYIGKWPVRNRLSWAEENEAPLHAMHADHKAIWLEVRKIVDGQGERAS